MQTEPHARAHARRRCPAIQRGWRVCGENPNTKKFSSAMLYIRNVFILPNPRQFPAAMIHMKKKQKNPLFERPTS